MPPKHEVFAFCIDNQLSGAVSVARTFFVDSDLKCVDSDITENRL